MITDSERGTVGIIGLGSVGNAVLQALEYFYDCVGFDIVGDYSWQDILSTEIAFVCVPTPEDDIGRLDCSIVDSVLSDLQKDHYEGLVVIKSTIGVGYMKTACANFHNLRLVYMPEFLREKSSFVWFVNPDRLVVSGSPDDVREALSYFYWVENAEILIMDYRSAELGKLAHNAYIATKVSFTNEIEMICDEFSGTPDKVMSVIWADRRVKSKEHLQPFLGPYDGKCVPKDTRELINASSCTVLLDAVEEVNEIKKKRR